MSENHAKKPTFTTDLISYDTVWECVIPYVSDPRDRDAVSTVCKRCYQIDSITRRHVTIALCYAVKPQMLSRRFPYLESLKLKGKPRAAMFDLIPEDWGGYVAPWVEEIARSFSRMKVLHFRRMIVTDIDLEMLAATKGKVLEVLILDHCSGFSTDGLLHIGSSCRNLKTLSVEGSIIHEKDGKWLHELASNNTVLKHLSFYITDLKEVRSEDLELIARRCPSLTSMKISDCDTSELIGFFRAAASLQEFGGGAFNKPVQQIGEGSFSEQLEEFASLVFPQRLCRLGLTYLSNIELPIVYLVASRLKKLDLLYTLLDTEGHCQLLKKCPNLEFLETRNDVGDRGLQVLAQFCKKMKRLRIERGADEQDAEGTVTHRGLIALSQGCLELEYIAVYVSDIANSALESIGTYCKNLVDFRLVLLDAEERINDLPLDEGVRSLLMGCQKLRRFALYLRRGGLTNMGLSYIGRYSPNVRWMLLGYVGESDEGLFEFAKGCPSLQKLEMRGCFFSERALASAALRLTSLRYIWVHSYRSGDGGDLLSMGRPYWNIEVIPARPGYVEGPNGERVMVQHHAHLLAYYSLAGQRTDFPEWVNPVYPGNVLSR